MRNRRALTQLRTFQKRASAGAGKENARALISALDKAAKRGIIHQNAANRRKARLNRALASGAKAAAK